MSLRAVPLMLLPVLLYLFLTLGRDTTSVRALFDSVFFSITMISAGVWTVSIGQAVTMFAVMCLFLEIVKSTFPTTSALIENSLSVLLFTAMIAGFLLWQSFATSEFVILIALTAFDFMAGAVVMTMTARRTVAMEQ